MSKGFLLDTCIISVFAKRNGPDMTVVDWMSGCEESFFISSITYYEVKAGLHAIKAVRTADEFAKFIATSSIGIFPVDVDISDRAARKFGEGKLNGFAWKMADLLIGATAESHGLSIVTRNVKDFSMWDICVLNPYSSD